MMVSLVSFPLLTYETKPIPTHTSHLQTTSQDEFERQKVEMTRETDRNRTGADRFVGKSDSMEESLKMQTVGLVKLEDFQQKRQALEEEKLREAARSNELKLVP
jgi:hypothetical protein